jgi:hypothetical protein
MEMEPTQRNDIGQLRQIDRWIDVRLDKVHDLLKLVAWQACFGGLADGVSLDDTSTRSKPGGQDYNHFRPHYRGKI